MVTRASTKPATALTKKPPVKASVKKAVATKPAAKAPLKVSKAPVVAKKPAAAKKVTSAKAVTAAPKKSAVSAPEPVLQAPKTSATPVSPAKPAIEPKVKARKAKLVRDSFTMPEDEYQVLSDVKKACLKAGLAVKKSELLRIGVALIKQLDNAKLKAAIASLPLVKAGRPKKEK
ncbi:hypothetical protein [Glaciimonas sp. PAMC28666]|uniref:hypothetical protein n=1 Tax=Glaciimonas sp. PAMC28666 TaxID=2807626 RepID=UPI0019629BE0|nr:hypothetical protein [Glaciimonas sp. PAMC28666]QRX82350.1 hypothetical protein JQN73_20035 [Glaciimonas sp. PAMC28666]